MSLQKKTFWHTHLLKYIKRQFSLLKMATCAVVKLVTNPQNPAAATNLLQRDNAVLAGAHFCRHTWQ